MIEQFIHQPDDDPTVLAVDLDRESHVLFRNQHHCGQKAEHGTAVPDDLGAAIIADIPPERVGVEHGLGRRHHTDSRTHRLKYNRLPHLIVRRLAEQPAPIVGKRAAVELNHQPTRHVIGADRQAASRRCVAAQIVALIEHRLIAHTAQAAVHARMRLSAVGTREVAFVVRGRMQHPCRFEHVVSGKLLPGFARDFFDQLTRHHVQNVVVGIGAAEAGRGFDVAQPPHRFGAAQVRARHEQQIPRAEPQAAAVHEQIANRHLAGHPRVIHLKAR